jgi:hypothetical protein
VIEGFTVKGTSNAPDVSPRIPEMVRVYACPGANAATLNVASKRAPVLSITQKGDETSTLAGLDEIEHAPASNGENPATGVSRRTSTPAFALPGVVVGMAATSLSTVKVPTKKVPGGVVASTIEIVSESRGVAEAPTTNPESVNVPFAFILHFLLTTSAGNSKGPRT